MKTIEKLENEINNAFEKSRNCRGEVCRTLESEVDDLESQLTSRCSSEGTCSTEQVVDMKNKIRQTYQHLPSDTHI